MAMTEAQIQALYQVTYPINFVANGDTVHDGFHKHIQEIERIYGLLGGLERSKVTTGDLVSTLANYVTKTEFNNHVNSTNPHPNLQLATLGGNLDVSRITGNWDLSRVTGQLAVGNINMAGLIAYLEGNTGFADWIKSIAGGGSGGNYLAQNGTQSVSVTVGSSKYDSRSSASYFPVSGSATVTLPTAYKDLNNFATVTVSRPTSGKWAKSYFINDGDGNYHTESGVYILNGKFIEAEKLSGGTFKITITARYYWPEGTTQSQLQVSPGQDTISIPWETTGLTS